MKTSLSWFLDHGAWTVPLLSLTALAAAGVDDTAVPNPFGVQYTDPRLAQVLVLIAAAITVVGLRSRIAPVLWVDTGSQNRALWLVVVTVLDGLAVAQAVPQGELAGAAYAVGISVFLPVVLGLTAGSGWGLAVLMAQLTGIVSNPSGGPARGWLLFGWSPPPAVGALLGACLLGVASWIYVTNLGGRRRF